jgi:hypothetical protein
VIKRRFMSVSIISVIIPLLLSCFGAESGKEEVNRKKRVISKIDLCTC